MNNNKEHLPNESDLKLAEEFGQYLEGNATKSRIQDPLFSKLELAKQQDVSIQSEISVLGQESNWNSISSQIGVTSNYSRRPIPLRSTEFSSWYRFAAAALVILTLSTILWYQFAPSRLDVIASRSTQVQTVILSDGSTVTLRPNSELAYTKNQSNFVSVVLTGEAVFDVVSNPTRVFTVETENSRVVVTGTRFNVKTSDSESSVYLLEGSVTFESTDASNAVVLNPGQASAIRQDGIPSEPFEFDEQSVIGWIQSRLMLNNRSLISVINELEAHFDVVIQIPDSLANETLGGSVSLESLNQTLQDLGLVLGGEFQIIESGVYQFSPDP